MLPKIREIHQWSAWKKLQQTDHMYWHVTLKPSTSTSIVVQNQENNILPSKKQKMCTSNVTVSLQCAHVHNVRARYHCPEKTCHHGVVPTTRRARVIMRTSMYGPIRGAYARGSNISSHRTEGPSQETCAKENVGTRSRAQVKRAGWEKRLRSYSPHRHQTEGSSEKCLSTAHVRRRKKDFTILRKPTQKWEKNVRKDKRGEVPDVRN